LADLDVFYKLCKQNKLKITPQRIEVYKTLVSCIEHPSTDAVFRKVKQVLPNISFDTVSRILNTFNDIGAAFVVEGSGDVKRFDGNLEKHQHLKCIKCKKIFDFHQKNPENTKILENLPDGFKLLRATVYIEGLCKSCQE